MADEGWVSVTLLGGPMDGTPWQVEEPYLADGALVMVDGARAHPDDPGMRADYAPVPGGDPAVWHWHGWVP